MRGVHETEVVIVGGGPVGLTASLCLSRLGVRHMLLERRSPASGYPRAIGLNQRTMELFGVLGISDVVAAAAAPLHCQERTAWYTSFDGPTPLHGRLLASRDAWGGGIYRAEYAAASPHTWRILAQLRLEPLLREKAGRTPWADLRFESEVTGLSQDNNGVTVRGQAADGPFAVKARYLIGADGGRTVASALGITETGPTNLVDMVSVHFSADLTRHRHPEVLMSWFVNPDLGGSVNTGFLYPVGPWDAAGHSAEYVFVFAQGSETQQFDERAAIARLKATLGIEDLDPVVHSVSHWYIQAVVADRFRSGRCFLAGDAAHRVPPWGALGMNTGLQDIQNLCWKLAFALREPQLDGLLDSYEDERRPIAQSVAANALASFTDAVGLIDTALGLDPALPASEGWAKIDALLNGGFDANGLRQALDDALKALDSEFHPHGADCGFFYTEGAFQPADANLPVVEADPLIYTPRTLPGHHLPHFWLPDAEADASKLSTVDLPGLTDFVLLVDGCGTVWTDAVERAGHPLARRLTVTAIRGEATSADHEKTWGELREVGATGAILVRPDGIVAWRWTHLPDDTAQALDEALRQISGQNRA